MVAFSACVVICKVGVASKENKKLHSDGIEDFCKEAQTEGRVQMANVEKGPTVKNIKRVLIGLYEWGFFDLCKEKCKPGRKSALPISLKNQLQ